MITGTIYPRFTGNDEEVPSEESHLEILEAKMMLRSISVRIEVPEKQIHSKVDSFENDFGFASNVAHD